MKKNNHSLTLLLILVMSVSFSCKKSADSPSKTNVEYQITPMNGQITKITYNDQTGNAVVLLDPAKFTNGSKTISISTKPFNARLVTTIENLSNSRITYTLVIKVDGEIKKFIEATAPAMAITTSSVEYTVQ